MGLRSETGEQCLHELAEREWMHGTEYKVGREWGRGGARHGQGVSKAFLDAKPVAKRGARRRARARFGRLKCGEQGRL